ncbi:beta family protein, partial [Leclercia adecarboxylata]|nr:beta family protein [Leclercia adecarboxylata]
MKPVYFPILKAKDAEFDALLKAPEAVSRAMIPLFEIPRFNPDLKKYQDDLHAKATFLSELSRKIGELRSGMFAMFDTYHWQNPGEKVETGEHHLSHLFNALKSYGVHAVL